MLATAFFVFASLWLGSLFQAYRGPNSLDFVTVRVDPAHKASLEPIMLHAVSPWDTRTPFSLDHDEIWRISRSRDSGIRAIVHLEISSPTHSNELLSRLNWQLSISANPEGRDWQPATISQSKEGTLELTRSDLSPPFSKIPSRKPVLNWKGDWTLTLHYALQAAKTTLLLGLGAWVAVWLWEAASPQPISDPARQHS